MSVEENKERVRRTLETVWNEGNVDSVDDEYSSEFVSHGLQPEPVDREGFKQFVEIQRTAFPDVHFDIEDVIAEGDRVVLRWTATGTHEGRLPNIDVEPTGEEITVTGVTSSRLEDGTFVESWVEWDQLGMLQQLGVVPELAESSASGD